jgi:dethiobiotin synthetase
MLQGTSSGVGKSLLATAFCRIFARAGLRVAPFKAQNMSLNAAVTADGGEIGRAQAAQAEAAGVEATVEMNPILLKPETDDRSQLVVRGRAIARVSFGEYRARQAELAPIVAECLARLRATHDVVVIEGAGSPAEINLRDADLVNMHVARLAEAPVLLVGDIDRGGVFGALVGTLALLPPADRARVAGLIINRLRGDAEILRPGLAELQALTGVPVLGVVPWIAERLVPSEDSLDLTPDAGDDAPSSTSRWSPAAPGQLRRFRVAGGRARRTRALGDEPGRPRRRRSDRAAGEQEHAGRSRLAARAPAGRRDRRRGRRGAARPRCVRWIPDARPRATRPRRCRVLDRVGAGTGIAPRRDGVRARQDHRSGAGPGHGAPGPSSVRPVS